MEMTAALEAVRGWPMTDQLEFVNQVWDQMLDAGWHPELTDEQKAELERRWAAYKADPANILTWDQVESHLQRQR